MYFGKNIFKTIMLKNRNMYFGKNIFKTIMLKNRNMYFGKIILIKVCKIQTMFTSKSIF